MSSQLLFEAYGEHIATVISEIQAKEQMRNKLYEENEIEKSKFEKMKSKFETEVKERDTQMHKLGNDINECMANFNSLVKFQRAIRVWSYETQ